jgi:DNA helicase-2/ATP-dependent DNA helicase PcrA
MSGKNYTAQFQHIFEALNQQQQAAVKQIEGPVMVLAGPGTGKTQILAARIANILLNTDTLAENILCLTYTDAGTVAMRKRLLSFIGPDAYRVQIATFHSFCNLVIQENLDVFGYRNLDPVSDLEQIQLMRELIDGLSKNHLLKRYTGEVYFEISRLLELFSIMKKEDWEPDFLLKKVEEYSTDLPNRENYQYKRKFTRKDGVVFNAGDLKVDQLNEELRKMEMLKAAILLFDTYQQILKKNNRYDFSDMILWVIKAFKENAALLANYQERFQYLLVDEFQDTSGSQNDLLQLLISYWDQPNIFTVGDDDQSIYRFQGASVENIEKFVMQFGSNLNLVTLENNYRSNQAILDAADALIKNNNSRINKDKKLIAANETKAAKPVIKACYHGIHESAVIGAAIVALKNAGVAPNEIAVLYRNHYQAEEMINFLKWHNIEVSTRKRSNVLQEPLIKKILLLMQYLVAETTTAHSGEPYLFEILHFQEFKLPTQEIAKLSLDLARKNFNERESSWREELKKIGKPKSPTLFDNGLALEAFSKFIQMLENLIQASVNLTVQETLHTIIRDCGFLGVALSSAERNWQMEILQTFFDFIKIECSKQPNHSLKTINELFQLMLKDGIFLPAEKIWYSEQGVNFITAHSSKGLEFDYVFLIGANSKTWDEPRNNRSYKLPDNLFTLQAEEAEEARRLFFVAMTRARKQLQLSYNLFDLNQKELEPSRFIAELNEAGAVQIETVPFNQEEVNDFLAHAHPENEAQIPKNIIDNAFTDSLLEKYSLSVTHLNNYLKCPLSFYFNNFIRVPAPKSASMTFGSAVHFALEQQFKKMSNSETKEFPGEEQMVKDFKWFMKRNQDSFTEIDFKRRLEYGETILPKYFNQYAPSWNKITSVEKPYRNVVVKGIPLNGKLDKLEFEGNHVNVVDYKTGSFKNAKNKFKRPNEEAVNKAKEVGKEPSFEDLHGGDYWRQAVFYKLLIDYDTQKKWDMRSSEFDFIEPQISAGDKGVNVYNFHKEKVNITPEDLEIVSNQIVFAFTQIQKKQFDKGCNSSDCHWCNFVKDYYTSNTPETAIPMAFEEEN